MNSSYPLSSNKSTGEAAVDGLLAGLLAGSIMALFLVVAGLLLATTPQVTLGAFDPAQGVNWVTGLLAHLAVSAIYGAVLGLLWAPVRRLWPSAVNKGWICGGLYGLLLFGLSRLLTATAVGAPLSDINSLVFGLAHVLYGIICGYWLGRN